MKAICTGLFVGMFVLTLAASADATPITIGQTGIIPTGLSNPVTSPTILDTVSGTFNLDSGALQGSYVEAVVIDPFGIVCAGCLDFAYQVTVDPSSTDSITRAGLLPFGSFTTDVDYVVGSGDVAPSQTADGPGGTISFFFTAVPIAPGQTSDIVLIATNATDYRVNGSLGFDVVSASGAHFSVPTIRGVLTPTTAVPEPASLTLTALGLVGAVARRRQRRSRSER